MAYRTVSSSALDFICGIPPVEILIEERIRLLNKEEDKMVIKAETQQKWMEIWNSTPEKDKWLRQIINDPEGWLNRKHGEPNFYITQAITGHGIFNSFLHKIGVSSTDSCPYCPGIFDSPEHTIFNCSHFIAERDEIEVKLGEPLTLTAFQKLICRTKEDWLLVGNYLSSILTAKRKFMYEATLSDACQPAISGAVRGLS